MFYETYKPPYYKDMSWSPSNRTFRSPGSSPETYRRIIRTEEDFPTRTKEPDDEQFFKEGRRSPTFPRRIFKEVWNNEPNRFGERPRMFKRVFKPSHWEDEVPNLRRAEFDRKFENEVPNMRRAEFDRKFEEDFDRPRFDDEFDRRFNRQKEEDFEKGEGKVHHIPIMVEKRMEEMKSRFNRNMDPENKTNGMKSRFMDPSENRNNEDEYDEEWSGPQVQRLRKTFEPAEGEFSTRRRSPRGESKPRGFAGWDPHAVHTLPTRKMHKTSQSFDDSRHPVPPKYVFRSCSETHEDAAKPQQQPHSAAFRSHSDGHCPNQTYVTKIEVNLPNNSKKEDPPRSHSDSSKDRTPTVERAESSMSDGGGATSYTRQESCSDDPAKPKHRGKYDSPSMQQIASVLQNVEDLVVRVENYSGAGRDKQYRFLDEMLTRCMLRLDDVDTEGREDIRNARKAALKEVQSCIDRLEARADESERKSKKKPTQEVAQEAEANPERNPLPEVIPLEDVPKEAVPKVIPLGDVPHPQVIPLGGNAIPLGYVEQNNNGGSQSNAEKQNGEQTKL